jgi:hypothetical protein
MRDAVLAELPGGQACALIARPRFVDPDMEWDAVVMSAIDGRQRRAPVDSSEPAGIAVCQNLDPRSRRFLPPYFGDQRGAMLTDRTADRDIRLCDFAGAAQGRGKPVALWYFDQRPLHFRECPAQIHCGRARRCEPRYREI